MLADNEIEVTVDQSFYPCFTIDGQGYHITLKGEIFHVTTKDRGKHYGYKRVEMQKEGKLTPVIIGVKIKNGNSFDELPQKVQEFIRKNYDGIMLLKAGESAYFPL